MSRLTSILPGTKVVLELREEPGSAFVATVISESWCTSQDEPHVETVCPACIQTWNIDYRVSVVVHETSL